MGSHIRETPHGTSHDKNWGNISNFKRKEKKVLVSQGLFFDLLNTTNAKFPVKT